MVSKNTQSKTVYRRHVFSSCLKRLQESRRFIQILAGPRQVGKTTLIHQLREKIETTSREPFLYVSVDQAIHQDRAWLETQWARGRLLCKSNKASNKLQASTSATLAIDEIQKIKDWATIVKALWDEDCANKVPLKVVLLGSSPLLMHKGSTESLAGRFEIMYVTHWSFQEMADCFDFTMDDYLYFGGYPGAASLRDDQSRWQQYVRDSLIEVTIAQDILAMVRIDKPALLKKLFYLCCEYSGQILSFTKMMGQLQEAGNTTTLAHYLDLLTHAGLATGLQKWSPEKVRTRASSPKLITLNSALLSAVDGRDKQVVLHAESKGRVVENAVGAFLWNQTLGSSLNLFYWNENNIEVDFVVTYQQKILAIEVKSGQRQTRISGLQEFCKRSPKAKPLLVGTGGVPLDEFLVTDILSWF